MRKIFFVSVLIVVLVVAGIVLVQGCLTGKVYTAEDAASVIWIKAGESFTIELAENPATGFSWHYRAGSPEILVLLSEKLIAPVQDEAAAGSPGRRQFQFQAVSKGEAAIVFSYYQEWVADVIADSCVFTVTIK